MTYSRHETMGRFPTSTDVAFFLARRQPRWALKIRNYQAPSKLAPNIDHVVNAHTYVGAHKSVEPATNLLWLMRRWRERGEDLQQRLLDMVHEPATTDSIKRIAFAKKWAKRLAAVTARSS